jgi:hypothetical protein
VNFTEYPRFPMPVNKVATKRPSRPVASLVVVEDDEALRDAGVVHTILALNGGRGRVSF